MKKQLIRKLAMIMTTALVISAAGCGGAVDGRSEFGFSSLDDNQPDNYEGRETCVRFTNKDIRYPEWTAHKGKWNDTADQGDKEAKLTDFAFIMEEGN